MTYILSLLVLLNAGPQRGANNARGQSPDVSVIFFKAQHALVAKDYPAAERGFLEVIKLDPRSAAAYSDLGVVYLRTQQDQFCYSVV